MATNETVGADAAKLAGLQVDLLQKFRDGQITLTHVKWFLGLQKGERNKLALVPGLPIWKTVTVGEGAEMAMIDLVKIDFSSLNLKKENIFHKDLRDKVKEVFGLKPCVPEIELLIFQVVRELRLGCMFISDEPKRGNFRVYYVDCDFKREESQ